MVCETWNDSDQTWDAITAGDDTQPILNCDTTNGITLEVASGDSFYDSYRPEVEVAYRVVFTSTYSLNTDGTEEVTDYFNITYEDATCDQSTTIVLTTGLTDFTYLVEANAAMKSYTPSFTMTPSTGCSASKTWYGKLSTEDEDAWQLLTDSSPIDFPTLGFAPSADPYDDLELTLTDETEWPSADGPVSYDIKVIYATDDSSEIATVSAEAIFTVTVVDACYYNELTCTDLDDITFTIDADTNSPGAASQTALSCTFSAVDNDGTPLDESTCPLT